jgi:hypothetical protein
LLRLVALNKLLLDVVIVRGDRGEKKSQNAAGTQQPYHHATLAEPHGMA